MKKVLGDNRIQFTYHGLSFQQNSKSPRLFAFVASSNELASFCGVARKSEGFLTNYQRAIDTDRVEKEITPFFRIPENSSPTAIVVSLHQTPICQIEFKKATVTELDPGVQVHELSLTLADPASITAQQIVDHAKAFLDQRLSVDPETQLANGESAEDETSDGSVVTPNELEEQASDDDEEGEEEADEDADATVEIGQSMLRTLRERLDDPNQLDPDLVETLREMLLPALVIDGQHRLFGAARVEEDIPLLVCSMIKPDWKEQVFQFTVINDKARGIPKPFITSLAGMSLTGQELEELRERLDQAGVKLWEVEVMQRIGYDSRSPFNGKIEFKVKGKGASGLGYQTMKRLGKAWYDPKNTGLVKIMRTLYAGDPNAKVAQKTLKTNWQSRGDWFEFFCVFWTELRDKFAATSLWETHTQLLTAVVLEQLQKVFLVHLGQVADLVLEDIDEEKEDERHQRVKSLFKTKVVEKWIAHFEKKHFETPWKIKSLNHKDGKAQLESYFERITKGQSTTNHPLLTGNV